MERINHYFLIWVAYNEEKTARLMRLISDVDFMVSRTNTNPQLALEVLMLAL